MDVPPYPLLVAKCCSDRYQSVCLCLIRSDLNQRRLMHCYLVLSLNPRIYLNMVQNILVVSIWEKSEQNVVKIQTMRKSSNFLWIQGIESRPVDRLQAAIMKQVNTRDNISNPLVYLGVQKKKNHLLLSRPSADYG